MTKPTALASLQGRIRHKGHRTITHTPSSHEGTDEPPFSRGRTQGMERDQAGDLSPAKVKAEVSCISPFFWGRRIIR